MDKNTQQATDTTGTTIRTPAVLISESRATFVQGPVGAATTDATARSEERTAVPNESLAADFSTHVHNYVSEHIRFADQKAAFIFAIAAGLLCYLFKDNVHKMWLKSVATWSVLDFLCCVAMSSLTVSLIFSCWVIVPNLRKTHRGFVFFKSIIEFESASAYASDILSAPATRLTRALLQHTYDLSRVSSVKYWKLSSAIWFELVGVLVTVGVLLLRP